MQGGEAMAALAPLVAAARQAVSDAGRDDLVDELDRLSPLVERPQPRVLVAGDFKQGKSELVNALSGAPVCAVDDDGSTAVVTEVVGPAAGRSAPPGAVAAGDEAAGRWWAERVEVVAARPLPAVLVDLPGQAGLSMPVALAAVLGDVAGVIMVSDASAELSRPEVEALEAVAAAGFPAVLAVPKVDFYSAWRKVCHLDAEHLAARELDIPVIPVSSVLEELGDRSADPELRAEAGFEPLTRWLEQTAGAATAAAVLEVADTVRAAVAGVREAARAASEGGDPAGPTLADLEARADRVQALGASNARWRRLLLDGIADLEADGEHALETRIRAIGRDAEAALLQGDPVGGWGRFSFWVAQRTSTDVAAAFGELSRQAGELSESVAATFEDEEATAVVLAPLRPPPIEGVAVPVDGDERPAGPRGRVTSSLGRLDSSGVLDGLAVLSLNPLSLAVGVLAGRRAVRTARIQEVESRRAGALDAVRRYLDEVNFVVRREWRSAVRSVERSLRDGYEAQAASLARSASDALEAARRAADDPAVRAAAEEQRAALDAIDAAVLAAVGSDG